MKPKLTFVLTVVIAITICSLQKANAQWSLTGNAGTNPASNFLGTTDSKALVFRTSNKVRMRIMGSGTNIGYIGIGVSSPVQKLDVNGNINIAVNSGLYIDNKRILSNTGTNNFFAGESAGNANTGSYNTAVGYQSLYANRTGVFNTATGFQSLYSNSIGGGNTANGSLSLYLNTTGDRNTAIGHTSLYYNNTGHNNTACGEEALMNNTTGISNTAVGSYALGDNVGGNENTAIGTYANVSLNDLTNATAIGYSAIVNASNTVVIGNNNSKTIGGFADWSNFSDGRFKENIKEDVPGLKFIARLRPVTYTVNIKKLNEHIMQNMPDSIKTKNIHALNKLPKVQTGFIAQEVEKSARESGYDFDGVNAPQNSTDYYSISYGQFVVPVVKAIQELSKQNDSLRTQNETLQKRLDKIEQMLAVNNALQDFVTNAAVSSVQLEQNTPNPFSNTTNIHYNLPANYKSAQIVITDVNGKTIKQVQLNTAGKGIISINKSNLSNGTYTYSLIVDGRTIENKKMVMEK